MWNRNDQPSSNPSSTTDRPDGAPPRSAAAATASGNAAVIGPSISIRGDLTGEEDLVIEGQVEGEVILEKHRVEVGTGGRVKADIHAKTIHVLGQVDGNLAGDEEVVIRASGRVAGNISAPRVTLEDGCNFRGTVDMSPRKKRVESPPAASGHKAGQGDRADQGAKGGPGGKNMQDAKGAEGGEGVQAGNRPPRAAGATA